jgi:hypothetical protein
MVEYVFAEVLARVERFKMGRRDELKRTEIGVRAQLQKSDELGPFGLRV